jgi:hypothetical protein
LLLKRVDYNKQHFKVREILNEYGSQFIGTVTGVNLLNYACGSLNMFISGNYDYVYQFYHLNSRWMYKSSSEEKIYDLEDKLNQKYFSQNTRYLFNLDHKQVTFSESINSTGQRIIHEYKYPLDAKDISPREMWSEDNVNYKHMHNRLIRETTSVNDKGIITKIMERTNYYRFDPASGLVLPDRIELSFNAGQPENRIRFTRYDSRGNLLEYVLSGGIQFDNTPVSFLWSYNQSFPVAKIENATYDEVINAERKNNINESTIQSLTNETDIRRELDKIRKDLPKAQMTIYTFIPLEGISSVTDFNGKTTYYSYDDLQRLEIVRDFEQKKVSEFQYQYQTYTTSK